MLAAATPAAPLRSQPAAGPLDAASLLEAAIHHTAMEQPQSEPGAAEDEQRLLAWLCGDAV
jgi:hypothetical protein